MGHLLAQQLLAAGERVLDVQFPAWLRWAGYLTDLLGRWSLVKT
jgi:hypothetical protein